MFAFLRKREPARSGLAVEVDHWKEVERRAKAGERQFWLNHPRVAFHYFRKAQIEGLTWQQWAMKRFGGPVATVLELGCGNGAALSAMVDQGVFQYGIGLDLDEARFEAKRPDGRIQFIEADINTADLGEEQYDLIYALQAFHHFEALEQIMERVKRALKPGGAFVLDEFVGPARFQWSDDQLMFTRQLLGMLPRGLRMYSHGVLKCAEGRSTVEDVVRVCPSEAIRSDEIPAVFRKHFRPLAIHNLGGTIQHLLYSGIIWNLPDGDPEVDSMIDAVDALETALIERSVLPSDFMLLVGERPLQSV